MELRESQGEARTDCEWSWTIFSLARISFLNGNLGLWHGLCIDLRCGECGVFAYLWQLAPRLSKGSISPL